MMSDMNNENKKNGKLKLSFGNLNKFNVSVTKRRFKSGAYTSVVSAVVIVLVLMVNLIVSELDLKIDLSTQGFYTLSEETREYVKGLENDVTLYYLIETGQEAPMFLDMALKFEKYSDRIKVEQVDPVLYPEFASQYVDDEVGLNSFLVVNNDSKRAKYVAYSDMVIRQFSQETYQLEIVGVDIEGQLISAIQYVTNPEPPAIYYTEGHAEKEVGEIFKDVMSRLNYDLSPLTTSTAEKVPENCDVLVINAPAEDFKDYEIDMIKEYMANGGNTVIIVNYKTRDLKNLVSLIDYYGVQIQEGIIYEGDSNRYLPLFPRYIVPEVLRHDITGSLYDSNRLLMTPVSSGLAVKEGNRSSLTVQPLLQTSEKAYSKVDLSSGSISKGEDDIAGPFYVGLISSDTYEGVTSTMVIYSSADIFSDDILSNYYGNYVLLINTVGNLVGEIETIAVKPRYLYSEPLNITQKPVRIWASVTIIVLPLMILATGIVIIVRRRRK